MDTNKVRRARRLWRAALTLALASVFWFVAAQPVAAQGVVHVEEDWELVVGTPEPATAAPQVTCIMSPFGHLDSLHAVLDLNHHDLPESSPGGVQLQIYDGEFPLASKVKVTDGAALHETGETITWTQRMRIVEGNVSFEIVNGQSSSWGGFGEGDDLKLSHPMSLTAFGAYSPDVSAANSGVSYAANRVQSLTLKRVRWYTANTLLAEDNTPRVVYSQGQSE